MVGMDEEDMFSEVFDDPYCIQRTNVAGGEPSSNSNPTTTLSPVT